MASLFAVEANHAPQRVRANDEAPLKIPAMLVTLDTSHFDRSALNDIAFPNMACILVTLLTSHFERSALKVVASLNMLCMVATLEA